MQVVLRRCDDARLLGAFERYGGPQSLRLVALLFGQQMPPRHQPAHRPGSGERGACPGESEQAAPRQSRHQLATTSATLLTGSPSASTAEASSRTCCRDRSV